MCGSTLEEHPETVKVSKDLGGMDLGTDGHVVPTSYLSVGFLQFVYPLKITCFLLFSRTRLRSSYNRLRP